jgi:hypothetical protein
VVFSTLEFPNSSKIHIYFRNVQFHGRAVPLREQFLCFTSTRTVDRRASKALKVEEMSLETCDSPIHSPQQLPRW